MVLDFDLREIFSWSWSVMDLGAYALGLGFDLNKLSIYVPTLKCTKGCFIDLYLYYFG